MKQGKMHYLNFRTLCAWSFMVLFLAALLGYLIYEKIRGNGAGWFPVIFGGCLLVLGICYAVVEIWLPYRRIEKRIELFLDGIPPAIWWEKMGSTFLRSWRVWSAKCSI